MLKNVLDGNMDSNTFEDTMREMFGIYAYISFTLDKVGYTEEGIFEWNVNNNSFPCFPARLFPMLSDSCNTASRSAPPWTVWSSMPANRGATAPEATVAMHTRATSER